MTGAEILAALQAVDGAGSGLDADLLDGQTAAAFEPVGTTATHAAVTTSVHGIDDTSVLETTSGAQAKVDAHVNDSSDAHDASAISFFSTGTIAATDVQAAIAEVASEAATALSTHDSDTTSVHGIVDTSVLMTDADVVAAIADHSTATDPHGDRAYTDAAIDGSLDTDLVEGTGIEFTAGTGTLTIGVDETVYIAGGTDVPIADGGTGASTASAARENLGLEIDEDVASPGYVDAAVVSAAVYAATQAINAQTGTSYTPVAGDVGKLVTLSNASAITVTLPDDDDVTVAVGGRIDFAWIGAGQPTFAAGSGATVNATPGLKMRAQFSVVTAIKRIANTWLLVGDLSA